MLFSSAAASRFTSVSFAGANPAARDGGDETTSASSGSSAEAGRGPAGMTRTVSPPRGAVPYRGDDRGPKPASGS